MTRNDLAELETLFASATAVVPMRDIHAGITDPAVLGLRHDVDDNRDSLATAVKIAAWEHARGFRSTFFILHTASYWTRPDFGDQLARIAAHGHEIGIHANAITVALTVGGDPADILNEAIEDLCSYGHPVTGVVAHGDKLCYDSAPQGSRLGFVNDELFTECARPEMGAPDRTIGYQGRTVRLAPRPLADFGLEYECYRLPRGRYLSDSGDRWNVPPSSLIGGESEGQLHVLQHPDWYREAL